MRYAINFDKTINQLVPYYLGGRKLILYLQSCIKPLQAVNQAFVEWAKETRIEASMTSQIFKLEWFLNRKFSKYFDDPAQKITIKNGEKIGTPIFNESAQGILDADQFVIYNESEAASNTAVLFHSNELTEGAMYSFLVSCPKLWKSPTSGLLKDGITENEFISMLTYYIDKYRISGKTYKITINK